MNHLSIDIHHTLLLAEVYFSRISLNTPIFFLPVPVPARDKEKDLNDKKDIKDLNDTGGNFNLLKPLKF
jgi:hypothetical protein